MILFCIPPPHIVLGIGQGGGEGMGGERREPGRNASQVRVYSFWPV